MIFGACCICWVEVDYWSSAACTVWCHMQHGDFASLLLKAFIPQLCLAKLLVQRAPPALITVSMWVSIWGWLEVVVWFYGVHAFNCCRLSAYKTDWFRWSRFPALLVCCWPHLSPPERRPWSHVEQKKKKSNSKTVLVWMATANLQDSNVLPLVQTFWRKPRQL